MNQREKVLLGAVGAGVALLTSAFCFATFFVKPLQELKHKEQALHDSLRQFNDERRAFFSADEYLKKLAPRQFGREAETASAAAGKMLTDQILALGLQESQFSRLPVGPRRLRGAQEVGWNVQGEGPLERIIDLLFVLEQTPQVHRLENLVLSATDRPGRVKARFRYLTLVIDGLAQPPQTNLKPGFALDTPERRAYDRIVQRDLLRPYVPRPPSPPSPPPVADTPESRLAALKVVSLSEWGGMAEAHVCDLTTQTITRYKPGDALAGGTIVMIDYSTLPLAGQTGLNSYSRMILKLGSDYWAVEQGQTLAAKRLLTPDQLPPILR